MSLHKLITEATATPLACRPEDTILSAVDLMAEHGRNALLVIDQAGLMRGIVTDQDVIRHLHAHRGRVDRGVVGSVMTPKVVTCPPETGLTEALSLMGRHGIRHLVVVDDRAPVGVLAIKDVLARLHEQDLLEIGVLRDIARTASGLSR